MENVKIKEPNQVKVGDVLVNHGRTNKTITKIIQTNEGGKWAIYHDGGRILFDYDDQLHIKA